ncbi:MAG: hypothetical protein PHN98_02120 [Smithellaceae bacterium]|nr:hypothetical protein [Smithellaceae bacterium]
MKRNYFIICIFLFLISLVGCDNPSQKAHNYSLEHKIAILNAGKYIDESDITVKRFRYLLISLESTTGYSQEKIGDQIVFTRNYIRDKFGKEVSILQITEAAYQSKDLFDKNVKLEEYLAIYAGFAGQ